MIHTHMHSVKAAAITIYINTSVGKIDIIVAHYTHTLQVMPQVAVLPCVFKICVYLCVCVCLRVGSLCMNNWFLS